jgi:secreted PhoX family phosphatase
MPAVVRPALGVFNHEAVAVDTVKHHLYLTEDKVDGCLYRFTADRFFSGGHADLSSGTLEVAIKQDEAGLLFWSPVPVTVVKVSPIMMGKLYLLRKAITVSGRIIRRVSSLKFCTMPRIF